MAKKLSEEQVRTYNELVDAGKHMQARAYLANTINPDSRVPIYQGPVWPSMKPMARSLGTDGPKTTSAPADSKAAAEPTAPSVAPAATVAAEPKPSAPGTGRRRSSPVKPAYKPSSCRPCFKAFKKKQK